MEGASSNATWPVLHGTLGSCISLESSLCPLDPTFAVSAPLLLQRPPTHATVSPPPCDITIVFPTKHEIRQIYVRSSARMYEIYHAPDSKSTNEYLCTVRCSSVQQVANDNDSRIAGEMSSRSSNTSNSEDSWVDITKSPESDTSKINASPPRTKEDLYEATAEISDAEPCISLTLRLVSIQSTGYVCVDDIYVYGDPVDDDNDDSEEQKNTAGSSLMALLAPTLLQLQLSKSVIGNSKNISNSKQLKDPISHDISSHGADLTSTTHDNLPEVTPSVSSQQAGTYRAGHTAADAAKPNESHIPYRVPDEVVNHNITTNDQQSRIEKALNELISRVIKIEDTCSRFEENMRKPICSIEERLSRVENQLSVLTVNSQNSKLASGTRFTAPDWSCIESTSNSSDVDESNPICGTANTHYISSVSLPAQPPGNMSSINMETIEVPPSISSTELQYETHDAEGTNPSIPIHDTSLEQPKKTVSIDDALASALAAFMSSGRPETRNKGFSIRAPEYLSCEDSESSNEHSSVSHCTETTSSIKHEDENEVTDTQCKARVLSFSNNAIRKVQDLPDNDPSSDQIEQHNEGSLYGKPENISQFMNGEGPRVEEHIESCCSSDKFEGGVPYVTDEEAYGDHKVESHRFNDDSANAELTAGEDAHSDASLYLRMENDVGYHHQKARNDNEATNQEALLQVTDLARILSPVNFDTPVLDVMFVSGNISSTCPSLEALLTDTGAGHQVEAPCDAAVSSSGDATADHEFISLEKETSFLETTSSNVNMHHFDLETTSMGADNKSAEIETVKDFHSDLSHEAIVRGNIHSAGYRARLGHVVHVRSWEDLLAWMARQNWKNRTEQLAIMFTINAAVYESWRNSNAKIFNEVVLNENEVVHRVMKMMSTKMDIVKNKNKNRIN